ncbi:Actin_related protein [Hexamita inflata]|uniref:Actin related protein n=1 Tax=Hexamita inflata TaxID=28002 RepID=A0AA86TV26_9EUKA|nr:Actin related protein [Hexamita inflata]CAI9928242.1 Actin related protein [Hexamita inflata]
MIPTISTASMNSATVIDLGSYQIKVGESSDARPAHALYSFSCVEGAEEYKLYDCESRPVIQNGQIADFDLLEQKLRQLQNYYPHMFNCVSILQPYFIQTSERQQLAELLFEKFSARAVHFGSQEAAACFGAGTSTGVCCDFGYGVTKTVPVVDGHCLESQGQVCFLNGELMGKLLVDEVSQSQNYSEYFRKLNSFKRIQLGNDLTQYFCSTSEQPIDPLQFEYQNISQLSLPDGVKLEVNKSSQLLPEMFFNSQIYQMYSNDNLTFNSIQYQFTQSIINQPAQVRKELVQNIVLVGGISKLNNLQNRFRAELDSIFATQSLTGKPKFLQTQVDRKDLTFFGGAVVASLSVFGYFLSSAQEWKEEGITGVERRRM